MEQQHRILQRIVLKSKIETNAQEDTRMEVEEGLYLLMKKEKELYEAVLARIKEEFTKFLMNNRIKTKLKKIPGFSVARLDKYLLNILSPSDPRYRLKLSGPDELFLYNEIRKLIRGDDVATSMLEEDIQMRTLVLEIYRLVHPNTTIDSKKLLSFLKKQILLYLRDYYLQNSYLYRLFKKSLNHKKSRPSPTVRLPDNLYQWMLRIIENVNPRVPNVKYLAIYEGVPDLGKDDIFLLDPLLQFPSFFSPQEQNQKTSREQAIKYLRNQGFDFQNEQLIEEYEKVIQFVKDPTELLLHQSDQQKIKTFFPPDFRPRLPQSLVRGVKKFDDFLNLNGSSRSNISNISDIPIYFLLVGGHASIVILFQEKVFSVGLGITDSKEVPTFLRRLTSIATMIGGGTKKMVDTFIHRGQLGNAVLFTPDPLVMYQKDDDRSKMNRKIMDIGILTPQHLQNLQKYYNRARKENPVELSVRDTKKPSSYKKKGNINIFLDSTYSFYSIPGISTLTKELVNCTSFMLNVFPNTLTCAGKYKDTSTPFVDPRECKKINGIKITSDVLQNFYSVLRHGDVDTMVRFLQALHKPSPTMFQKILKELARYPQTT